MEEHQLEQEEGDSRGGNKGPHARSPPQLASLELQMEEHQLELELKLEMSSSPPPSPHRRPGAVTSRIRSSWLPWTWDNSKTWLTLSSCQPRRPRRAGTSPSSLALGRSAGPRPLPLPLPRLPEAGPLPLPLPLPRLPEAGPPPLPLLSLELTQEQELQMEVEDIQQELQAEEHQLDQVEGGLSERKRGGGLSERKRGSSYTLACRSSLRVVWRSLSSS